jgi:hypothetical protein
MQEIERFVSKYGSLVVNKRNNKYVITGYYDDLDPEPQREKLHNTFSEMRRDIEWNNEFPEPVETVSEIKTTYGQIKLYVTVS